MVKKESESSVDGCKLMKMSRATFDAPRWNEGDSQWVTTVRSQGFNHDWTGNTIENSLGPAVLAARAAVLTVRDELSALLEKKQ